MHPDFALAPDGQVVVYRADQEVDGRNELFRAPIDGSASAVKLNAPLGAGQSVGGPVEGDQAFEIAPDGVRVVYRADQGVNDVFELFSVPIDASASPVELSGPLLPGAAVLDFAFSADGTRVAYRASQDTLGVTDLYGVPSDASASAIRLSGPFVTGGDVHPGYAFSADGARLLYLADQEFDEVDELHATFRLPAKATHPGPTETVTRTR